MGLGHVMLYNSLTSLLYLNMKLSVTSACPIK